MKIKPYKNYWMCSKTQILNGILNGLDNKLAHIKFKFYGDNTLLFMEFLVDFYPELLDVILVIDPMDLEPQSSWEFIDYIEKNFLQKYNIDPSKFIECKNQLLHIESRDKATFNKFDAKCLREKQIL